MPVEDSEVGVLPEQTEDGAPSGEGDQRQTVTQRVQCLHDHVEDQLQTRADERYWQILIIVPIMMVSASRNDTKPLTSKTVSLLKHWTKTTVALLCSY